MDQSGMNPMPGGMNPMPGQNNVNSGANFNAASNNFAPNPVVSNGVTGPAPGAVPTMPNPVAVPQQNMAAAANPVIRPNIGLVNMNGAAPIEKEKRPKMRFPLFSIVGLTFACAVAGIAVVIAVSNSLKYKNLNESADFSIEQAVLAAKAEQQSADEKEFLEKEKWGDNKRAWGVEGQWGKIEFDYPGTWSNYVAKANEGDYQAYFRPDYVGPIADKNERFALRLSIVNKDLESVQALYKKMTGTRCEEKYSNASSEMWCYSGEIEKNMVGQIVLVKLGDSQKTAILQSDAMIYKDDFEKVLSSLRRSAK
jgi:hypothetical protein